MDVNQDDRRCCLECDFFEVYSEEEKDAAAFLIRSSSEVVDDDDDEKNLRMVLGALYIECLLGLVGALVVTDGMVSCPESAIPKRRAVCIEDLEYLR